MSKRNRQKGKRAYLKRFSSEYVNAGRVNKTLTAYGTGEYSRGRYTDPPTTKYTSGKVPDEEFKDRPATKLTVRWEPSDPFLARIMNEWQTPFFQGKEEYRRIKMPHQYEDIEIHLFFSGQQFFFIAEHYEGRGFVRSCIYPNKQSAEIAFRHKLIRWEAKSTDTPG